MKIVLTGGPSAGKTALVGLIEKKFYNDVSVVPEAATILFKGGLPREISPSQINHQQRAIYFLQREMEAMATDRDPKKILICDRGTADGAAYCVGPVDDFFNALGTSLDQEIKRYDYVIHLESPSCQYFDHSSPVRIKNPTQAALIDDEIRQIWARHPNRFIIHCRKSFDEKSKEVLGYISNIVEMTFGTPSPYQMGQFVKNQGLDRFKS